MNVLDFLSLAFSHMFCNEQCVCYECEMGGWTDKRRILLLRILLFMEGAE